MGCPSEVSKPQMGICTAKVHPKLSYWATTNKHTYPTYPTHNNYTCTPQKIENWLHWISDQWHQRPSSWSSLLGFGIANCRHPAQPSNHCHPGARQHMYRGLFALETLRPAAPEVAGDKRLCGRSENTTAFQKKFNVCRQILLCSAFLPEEVIPLRLLEY